MDLRAENITSQYNQKLTILNDKMTDNSNKYEDSKR